MSEPSKSKLGRGLSALMAEVSPPEEAVRPDRKSRATEKPGTPKTATKKPAVKKTTKKKIVPAKPFVNNERGVHYIGIDLIAGNPDQPRKHFDPTLLDQLASSIREKGVLSPILLRPVPEKVIRTRASGTKKKFVYQIVAGERRYQAAVSAGLVEIPALVRNLNDQEVLEIGVVENVQRADLNPVEEALAYEALKKQFGRTQEDIARAASKSRPYIANALRLLTLPELARDYLACGEITAGHARAILSAPDQLALTEAIVDKRLSVREAENWVRLARARAQAALKRKTAKHNDANTRFIEKQMSEHLGLKVSLLHKNPGGVLNIKYKTLAQLEDLIGRLRKL